MIFNFYSCNTVKKSTEEQILAASEDYLSMQLKNPETRMLEDSTIMIGDSTKRYFIPRTGIHIGLIDDDDTKDAIISATMMEKSGRISEEHLLLLCLNGKYTMVRTLEQDMKIISVSDRVITADVPLHPVNNPLHDCPVCREVIKYRYSRGELEKIK